MPNRSMLSYFPSLNSDEAKSPAGVWNWAKRLVQALDRLNRVVQLAELDLSGKGGYTVKVKADESGFELVP